MTAAELALARIEAVVDELEQLDRETGGAFRQSTDREAYDIAARIERKLRSHYTPSQQAAE